LRAIRRWIYHARDEVVGQASTPAAGLQRYLQ
jgi:hypothetical protein